jgi:hypothetical protein
MLKNLMDRRIVAANFPVDFPALLTGIRWPWVAAGAS